MDNRRLDYRLHQDFKSALQFCYDNNTYITKTMAVLTKFGMIAELPTNIIIDLAYSLVDIVQDNIADLKETFAMMDRITEGHKVTMTEEKTEA